MKIKGWMTLGILLMLLAPSGAWAEELFDRAAAERYFQEGLKAHYQGRYQEAVRRFETAIQINPDDARPYYFLGYSYYRLRELGKAQDAFEQVYQVNPDYSPLPSPSNR